MNGKNRIQKKKKKSVKECEEKIFKILKVEENYNHTFYFLVFLSHIFLSNQTKKNFKYKFFFPLLFSFNSCKVRVSFANNQLIGTQKYKPCKVGNMVIFLRKKCMYTRIREN